MTSATPNPYPSTPIAASTSNAAGRASLVVAVVIVGVGVLQQLATYVLPTLLYGLGSGMSEISWVFGAFGLLIGVLAIVALILGIIGLSRPGTTKAAAGAGTAIGASSLLSVMIGLLGPLFLAIAG